ncbi:MAG TPA: hypothetical protein VFX97_20000 [Pyrinomonadaceae bacterium]|nr:hypothetical protein [Pyrinomonadaceae bacterium]
MGKDNTQRAAHTFLLEHLQTQEPFTLAEFVDAVGWDKKKPRTYETYLSKLYKGLIENVGGGFKISPSERFHVTESFRKLVDWRRFKQHVTQVRRVVTDYEPIKREVLIYDFLMPLTNEAYLRTTLDALFYKDTLLAKLRTISSSDLSGLFPRLAGISDDLYLLEILNFIEDHFVGYSISHVDGRFRSGKVLTQDEVAAFQKIGRRYLVDETTAVTRFIFPYQDDDELAKIRLLFKKLFVRSIIQLVNGEEQIWMIESGPESKVHIWQSADESDA